MPIRGLKFSLLVSSILLHHQVYTQSNYQPAIVINNSGDSVRGQLDYRNWKKNPETVFFIDAANVHHTFNASSIKGFIIPSLDEVYSSYNVDVDMRPGNADEAIRTATIDSPVLHKSVFLLQLIGDPKVQLYQFTDDNKEHFYFLKSNTAPVELIHHFIYDQSGNQVKENSQFKEQLVELFSDCPNVTPTLKAMKFKKRDIENSFLNYLQCKGASSTTTRKIEDKGTLSVGGLLGVMHTTYSFEGSDEDLVDDNYTSSTTPLFGVSLDIGLPRNRNQWHIVNELVYKSYKTGSTFTRPYNISYTRTSTVEVDFGYLQLNSMLRYLYPSSGILKPYVNLGIGNAFIIAEKTNRLHQSYSFGQEEEMKAFDDPNNYEFSLLGGIGLRIQRVEVEFRYTRSKKSFSPYHTLDTNPRSFQGLLVFRF